MKNIVISIGIAVLFAACQSGNQSEKAGVPAGVHSAIVEEVLQANQYTYLHVKENGNESWLAVPKMEAKAGDTYYYKDGLMMKDFNSKDLNRTFSEIYFIDNVSPTPNIPEKAGAATATAANEGQGAMSGMDAGASAPVSASLAHTVKSLEVLQTTQYTYLRVKEGELEYWVAANKMDGTVGKTYYFKGGLPMTNFASKELKRTFPEVLFLDNISDKPIATDEKAAAATAAAPVTKGSTVDTDKKDVAIKHSKDDITIAKLLGDKKSFAGKTVKIKGQVTKFTSGVMKKNWIHLQDGTENAGKFDLAVTTDADVKVGDNITVEGVITLDKDFGFGYFYDILMENAKITK